jgi:hypothetical protein
VRVLFKAALPSPPLTTRALPCSSARLLSRLLLATSFCTTSAAESIPESITIFVAASHIVQTCLTSTTSSLPSLAVTRMLTSKKERREYTYLDLSMLSSFFTILHLAYIYIGLGMALTAPSSSVAASSPNSLGSDAMEESDSEADNDDDVPARSSDIPYPLEGKYIDAKDKARINGLPQLERERILGERAEELNKAQWAAELSRRAKEKELQGTPTDRKRKASSIEPDDSQRKSSRQKVRGKNEKLEAYKLERAQRGQQRQRHDDRRNRRRSSSYDSRRGSDRDADGESEVEYTEYDNAPRQEEPAELRHFESIRVGRGFFAEVCFNPGFEEAMAGAFVRVGTGQDSHHRTLYKMAQIKGMFGSQGVRDHH